MCRYVHVCIEHESANFSAILWYQYDIVHVAFNPPNSLIHHIFGNELQRINDNSLYSLQCIQDTAMYVLDVYISICVLQNIYRQSGNYHLFVHFVWSLWIYGEQWYTYGTVDEMVSVTVVCSMYSAVIWC